VVDLTRYAPGPFCTLVAAGLGAEVIKVELPPEGDPLRRIDSAAFDRLNAGKKSVALDWKAPGGADALRRLVKTADVLVEGFRPGVMARLGLDEARLRGEAPSLIYVSITGYGQSGPYRDRAGHDVNYMAVSGALDGVETPLPLQVADFAGGGLFAITAILAALLERRSSGLGRHLDLSMHHGLLSLLMLGSGDARERLAGSYPNYSLYRTKDGGVLSVGALEPKFWRAFCEAIDRPDLEARSGDRAARSEVARVIEARDLDSWEEVFAGVDACVEGVRSPDEAREHPQALHRGAGSPEWTLPFPTEPPELVRAPVVGEHTEEVLLALGYAREELSELRRKGIWRC
jgi:crotonobetainyl-CoA:carnitine CoA-transferase CaiB-like acyl-CoA transferase